MLRENDYTSFGYDEIFQKKFLKLILTDPAVFIDYNACLKTHYFSNEILRTIARVVFKILGEFQGASPDIDVLKKELLDNLRRSGKEEWVEETLANLDQIYDIEIANNERLKQDIIQFAQREEIIKLTSDLIRITREENVRDFDIDKARDNIYETLNVGFPVTKSGIGVLDKDTIDDVVEILREDYNRDVVVPTPLQSFNRNLMGGITPKRLGVLLAPFGVGKSMTLVSFGVAAMRAGFSVAHYAIGDMTENDVRLRYLANITNKRMNDILDPKISSQQMQADLGNALNIATSDFVNKDSVEAYVRRLQPKQTTVDFIRNDLLRHQKAGRKIGLVIVDYADRLKSRGFKGDEWQELGVVYDELISLADDFSLPIWTASQVKNEAIRESKKRSQIIGAFDIAGSTRKADHADIIASINVENPVATNIQQAVEQGVNSYESQDYISHGALAILKVRGFPDGYTIPITINKSRSRFFERTQEQEDVSVEEANNQITELNNQRCQAGSGDRDESTIINTEQERVDAQQRASNPLSGITIQDAHAD